MEHDGDQEAPDQPDNDANTRTQPVPLSGVLERAKAGKAPRGAVSTFRVLGAVTAAALELAAQPERGRSAAAGQAHALAAAAQDDVNTPANVELAIIEGAGITVVTDPLQGRALRCPARRRGAGGAQNIDGLGATAVMGPAARMLFGAGSKPDRTASRPGPFQSCRVRRPDRFCASEANGQHQAHAQAG